MTTEIWYDNNLFLTLPDEYEAFDNDYNPLIEKMGISHLNFFRAFHAIDTGKETIIESSFLPDQNSSLRIDNKEHHLKYTLTKKNENLIFDNGIAVRRV